MFKACEPLSAALFVLKGQNMNILDRSLINNVTNKVKNSFSILGRLFPISNFFLAILHES